MAYSSTGPQTMDIKDSGLHISPAALAATFGGTCSSAGGPVLVQQQPGHWHCPNGHRWEASLDRVAARGIGFAMCMTCEYSGTYYFCTIWKPDAAKALLTWRCDKGHEWAASMRAIAEGFWCASCDMESVLDLSKFAAMLQEMTGGAIILAKTPESLPDTVKNMNSEYFEVSDYRISLAEFQPGLRIPIPVSQCRRGHLWRRHPVAIRRNRLRSMVCERCDASAAKAREPAALIAAAVRPYLGPRGLAELVVGYLSFEELAVYGITAASDSSSLFEVMHHLVDQGWETLLKNWAAPPLRAAHDIYFGPKVRFGPTAQIHQSNEHNFRYRSDIMDAIHTARAMYSRYTGPQAAMLIAHAMLRPRETLPYLPDFDGGRASLPQYLLFRALCTAPYVYEYLSRFMILRAAIDVGTLIGRMRKKSTPNTEFDFAMLRTYLATVRAADGKYDVTVGTFATTMFETLAGLVETAWNATGAAGQRATMMEFDCWRRRHGLALA